MSGITAKVVGARVVATGFATLARDSSARGRAIVGHYTLLLQTKVRGNASGRPGPNAPTGDYRRSISRRVTSTGGSATGVVGTNSAQGRRLELGFTGVDSLGRHYNQPPYPHFGPAVEAIEPQFMRALEEGFGAD